MERYDVAILNIWETLIPCVWMLGVVQVKHMNDHPIDNLCLAISLEVEDNVFVQLGVQQCPKARPKCAKEYSILI
jgi:hypothetical protein